MLLPMIALIQAQGASCCAPSMADFVKDPSFSAKHPSPRALDWTPEAGKNVTFPSKDGTAAKGFYVPGKGAAILLVHEWWGLNDYMRRESERIHDATGYAVLALDMYDGKVATDAGQAGKLMSGMDEARGKAIAQGGLAALKTGAFGSKYAKFGTIGWCFGGGWSLNTAILGGSSVKAAVAYYGMPPQDVTSLKAPVLFIWPKQDKWINAQVVGDFEKKMKAAQKPVTVLTYDQDHAFANPSNPKYSKSDADAAMAKTLAFFKKNLG